MTGPASVSGCPGRVPHNAYLDIIALVVVTAFTEESVVHNAVDIELIEERVAVLCMSASKLI